MHVFSDIISEMLAQEYAILRQKFDMVHKKCKRPCKFGMNFIRALIQCDIVDNKLVVNEDNPYKEIFDSCHQIKNGKLKFSCVKLFEKIKKYD